MMILPHIKGPFFKPSDCMGSLIVFYAMRATGAVSNVECHLVYAIIKFS
jgi:hypothetical protein